MRDSDPSEAVLSVHPARPYRGPSIATDRAGHGERPDEGDAVTTPFTRTARAITIVLVGCSFHVGSVAAQARRTDSRLFINEMTMVGLTEVRLGQMAAERGERADVKAFGQGWSRIIPRLMPNLPESQLR